MRVANATAAMMFFMTRLLFEFWSARTARPLGCGNLDEGRSAPARCPGLNGSRALPATFQSLAIELETDVGVRIDRAVARELDNGGAAVADLGIGTLGALQLHLKRRDLGLDPRGDVPAAHRRIVGLGKGRGSDEGGES